MVHVIISVLTVSADTIEITEGIKTAAEHYGAQVIQLGEMDITGGHPTALGMEQIKQDILNNLK